MIDQLKPSHKTLIDEYVMSVVNKTQTSYMLTIARDGEDPARTIIYYANAIEAAEAYNKYTDWGFAKNYLTVRLYEPNGIVNQKVLKRNQAGECTFVRQDYVEAQKILLKVKGHLSLEVYTQLVKDFTTLFAKDSWRFDPDRFLQNAGLDESVAE